MAITGAGSRLHAHDTSPLSLLYDFEELEGEWDFLSRVVALTFYPTVTGRKPLTLGEVDILEHIIVDNEPRLGLTNSTIFWQLSLISHVNCMNVSFFANRKGNIV